MYTLLQMVGTFYVCLMKSRSKTINILETLFSFSFLSNHSQGGTSLVYSQLISALTDKCRKSAVPFRLEHKPIDLPGRFFRQKERAIVDIPELAASLVQELFEKRLDENNDEAFVLFGHSYGSIVAFETAKYLQENNMKKPLALFVSASRPPSSKCLTSESFIPVSEMKFDEMMKYFQDRGSSLTKEEFMTDELKALFVGNVR
jgi:Predicted thioesterase involved in non-ribosomal peptide biosynthesis